MHTANLTEKSLLSLLENSYVYKILPVNNGHLAAISSDDSLRIVDAGTLQEISGGTLQNVHHGITCLEPVANDPASVCTAGRDGTVKRWDLRSGKSTLEFRDGSNAAYLSLCSWGHGPVVGTELANHQAAVILWDNRAPIQPKQQYIESHNDDITVVNQHPLSPTHLLSGSTDGLINIYNTTITDEDDALIQVANHGSSIHHANFISPTQFFGLSHDEQLSIYHLENVDDVSSSTEDVSPIVFGDLRPKLDCEYAVDMIPSSSGEAILGAGSHSSQQLDLIPLRQDQSMSRDFDRESVIRLSGVHGGEIVRSIYLNHDAGAIYTAGEDGNICAWRASSDAGASTVETEKPKKKKKRDSVSDAFGRFKPY